MCPRGISRLEGIGNVWFSILPRGQYGAPGKDAEQQSRKGRRQPAGDIGNQALFNGVSLFYI